MSKTMSVRMDRDNYDFLHEITKEEGSDLSKAVRDMVTRGRVFSRSRDIKRERPHSAGLRNWQVFPWDK